MEDFIRYGEDNSEYFRKKIGQNMAKIRTHYLFKNQAEIAEAMGMDYQVISKSERGLQRISAEIIAMYCHHFKVNPDAFFYLDEIEARDADVIVQEPGGQYEVKKQATKTQLEKVKLSLNVSSSDPDVVEFVKQKVLGSSYTPPQNR